MIVIMVIIIATLCHQYACICSLLQALIVSAMLHDWSLLSALFLTIPNAHSPLVFVNTIKPHSSVGIGINHGLESQD
jgi:hypothetical protein